MTKPLKSKRGPERWRHVPLTNEYNGREMSEIMTNKSARQNRRWRREGSTMESLGAHFIDLMHAASFASFGKVIGDEWKEPVVTKHQASTEVRGMRMCRPAG